MTHTPIKRTYAAAELEDGTAFSDVRVTFQTRRQLEKTMKAQGWESETHTFTIAAFMAWHAGKREGKHNLGWDDFVAQLVDCELTQPDGDPTAQDEDEELTPIGTATTV